MKLQELWYQAAENSGSKQRRQRSEERERERERERGEEETFMGEGEWATNERMKEVGI